MLATTSLHFRLTSTQAHNRSTLSSLDPSNTCLGVWPDTKTMSLRDSYSAGQGAPKVDHLFSVKVDNLAFTTTSEFVALFLGSFRLCAHFPPTIHHSHSAWLPSNRPGEQVQEVFEKYGTIGPRNNNTLHMPLSEQLSRLQLRKAVALSVFGCEEPAPARNP